MTPFWCADFLKKPIVSSYSHAIAGDIVNLQIDGMWTFIFFILYLYTDSIEIRLKKQSLEKPHVCLPPPSPFPSRNIELYWHCLLLAHLSTFFFALCSFPKRGNIWYSPLKSIMPITLQLFAFSSIKDKDINCRESLSGIQIVTNMHFAGSGGEAV